MKIVIRHKVTGRYYNAPGKWVRRADNALTFDDVLAAREFTRANHLEQTQPVQRLAPYLMGLLSNPQPSFWDEWQRQRTSGWYSRMNRFFRD